MAEKAGGKHGRDDEPVEEGFPVGNTDDSKRGRDLGGRRGAHRKDGTGTNDTKRGK